MPDNGWMKKTDAPGPRGRRMVTGARWLYAALGLFLFLFQGLVYAWSVFMPPLEADFGWSRSDTAMAFSICMTFFCVGNLAAGLLSRRCSARPGIVISALSMGAGFFLASRCDGLMGLYLSYGGLVGFGVGLGYNTLLSTMLKWFPDKPGLVSGVMLMGFGAGALALGPFCSWLVIQSGWRGAFEVLAALYAVLYLVASVKVVPPPSGLAFPAPRRKGRKPPESGGEVRPRDMVRRLSFRLYFAWAICMGSAGYILIGHAVPLAASQGVPQAQAALLAGVISFFNGLGRLGGGAAFDLFGRKAVMRTAGGGCLLCALLLFLAFQTGSRALLALAFGLTGLCLGGAILCHAVVMKTFYGLENYSMNYGILGLATMIASFTGPYITGLLHDSMGTYAATPFCMLILGAAALLIALTLRKP